MTAQHVYNPDRPVLFFDGICHLCHRAVQVVAHYDKKEIFFFASLQSPAGREAIEHLRRTGGISPDSLLVYEKGRYYYKSGAIIRIAEILGGKWKIPALLLKMLPRFIRDGAYRLIARYRYRIWGRKDSCTLSGKRWEGRVLHDRIL